MKAFIFQVAFAPDGCELPFKDSDVKPLVVNIVADSIAAAFEHALKFDGRVLSCTLAAECDVCGTIVDFE